LFNSTIPFTVSLPLPLPFPLPILNLLGFPLPIRCSLPYPCPLFAALHVLLTLIVVIVISISRTAPSTSLRTWIQAVLVALNLVQYLIPIQWSNSQEVGSLVLPAAWWLNICPEIIATMPRETLSDAINLCRAGCLQIGVIDLIPEGMWVILPPIVRLVARFVKHLPHL